MKRKTLAVILLTATLACTACNLFSTRQANATNPLLGKWKIDSIATTNDSTAFGYLLLAMSINDSAVYDYHFEKDTVTFFGKGDETMKARYTYNDADKQLVLSDSEQDTFLVRQINDTTTGLQGKDSSVIYLKRR